MLRNNSLICDFLVNALDDVLSIAAIFNHNIQPLIDVAYIYFPLCIRFMLSHMIIFFIIIGDYFWIFYETALTIISNS